MYCRLAANDNVIVTFLSFGHSCNAKTRFDGRDKNDVACHVIEKKAPAMFSFLYRLFAENVISIYIK